MIWTFALDEYATASRPPAGVCVKRTLGVTASGLSRNRQQARIRPRLARGTSHLTQFAEMPGSWESTSGSACPLTR